MKHEKTAKRLSLALRNSNITQQELSEKSNVSKSSISQYVNGSHKPSNLSAGRIGNVLNVNPLWLIGYDVPMNVSDASELAEKEIEFEDLFSRLKENDQKEIIELMKYKISNYRD